MPTTVELEQSLKGQLHKLITELDRRAAEHRLLELYRTGEAPLPAAVVAAKVTTAYRMLMPMADAPWGSLIVDSTRRRLGITGIRTGESDVDSKIWRIWQANAMDADSKLAHDSALTSGRAFALVWPDSAGEVEITLDNAEQMIILYRDGSRRHRLAALRRWIDDAEVTHATLYRPDGVYKFRQVTRDTTRSTPQLQIDAGGVKWQQREISGEDWPMANPYNVVPAVELPVNRRLAPGPFPYARGEYAHCIGLIERIHLLTFLGLVVAFWMGFPLRGVIGEILKTDDNGDLIPPFDAHATGIFQLEKPDAKIVQYDAADRSNLSVFTELDHLSTVTATPRHYFPMANGMANLSADAIRASEGAHVAKIPDHKDSLSDGWEEVLRLAGLMNSEKLVVPPTAELQWSDHESRSMAERADAAIKLKDILPWQVIAERVLNASDGEIARWTSMRSGDAFAQLVAAAGQPAPAPAT